MKTRLPKRPLPDSPAVIVAVSHYCERIDRAVPHLRTLFLIAGGRRRVLGGALTYGLLVFCSIAPNTGFPFSSTISIRIVSPKRMKGVLGAPSAIVSLLRCCAMQE